MAALYVSASHVSSPMTGAEELLLCLCFFFITRCGST